MASSLTIHLSLTASAAEVLRRPVNGVGGFQSLLRSLQASLSREDVLTLSPELAGRVATYVKNYGGGGFQGRLDAVLTELTSLANALRPMAA